MGWAAWLLGKRKLVGLEFLGLEERKSLFVLLLPESVLVCSGLAACGSICQKHLRHDFDADEIEEKPDFVV